MMEIVNLQGVSKVWKNHETMEYVKVATAGITLNVEFAESA